ncbi:hypothetical protein ACUHMQ_04925 [Chitinimonas sp. PSY-7]|uniref:hypothetical protein n=1 Tax=Chitinimonas sp. PSY-7 TaxID=3459088 RepID=UPI00403FE835
MQPTIQRLFTHLAIATLTVACAHKNPNERVTGNGGNRLLRVSSHQVTVDLTQEERQALAKVQDRHIISASELDVVNASVVALSKMGFAPVKADTDLQQIEGERNKVVSIRWRMAIRAMLKAKGIPLKGKPDHESIRAFVSIRPGKPADVPLVRARFDITVWDTNGDSRTTTIHDGAIYTCFFSQLNYALFGETHSNSTQSTCDFPSNESIS